jgi:DNA-binding CsgD family transcriptional regulator
MELLSVAAGDLLARLMASAGAPIGDEPGQVHPDDPALLELCECGLAAVSGRRAVPIAPATALTNLLARRQRALMDSHRELLTDYERLIGQSVSPASGQLELLTCETDVLAALRGLQAEVSCEYCAIDLLPLVAVARPKSPHRQIYTKNLLSSSGLVFLAGWQYKLIGELPLRMALCDGAALVMLSPSGHETAAMIRMPTLITALRHYFDLLWCQATALDGEEGKQLTRIQRLIVGMLLSGLGDEAIARSLGVSTRSVRRHVASLELLAGVSSRFALGAAAVRLGWVDPRGDAVR